MKSYYLTSLLFTLSFCGQVEYNSTTWKSSNRNLSFDYSDPWSILPTMDAKEKTLTGVIDKRDGKSYVIHITDDTPQEKLGNKVYFDGIKQKMFQANERNRLISEYDTTFHGMKAHCQIYLMYTNKWGLLKQVSYTVRTGIEFASVQILFPTTEENAVKEPIPSQIVEFDKILRVNLK